jgi:Golgi apparatus protein 1
MSKSEDVVVALLLVLAAAAAVSAGDAYPCREDMARLCAGVTPGEGRLWDCVRAHAKELSPACRARLRAAERMSPAGRLDPRGAVACGGDVERLCKGIPSGAGRWLRCLQEHATDLSDACRERIRQATAHADAATK